MSIYLLQFSSFFFHSGSRKKEERNHLIKISDNIKKMIREIFILCRHSSGEVKHVYMRVYIMLCVFMCICV